jgi:hypothetical protein
VDLAGISSALTDAATLRVRDLLAPAGVGVFGSRAAPGIGGPWRGFRIVLMGTRSSLVAGAVNKVTGREVEQLTAWVYPAAIAAELSLDLTRARFWTIVDRREFCRALAVVVVHELAHGLVKSGHVPGGLMAARLGRRQLLDPGLGIDPDLGPSLRSAATAFEAAGRAMR